MMYFKNSTNLVTPAICEIGDLLIFFLHNLNTYINEGRAVHVVPLSGWLNVCVVVI